METESIVMTVALVLYVFLALGVILAIVRGLGWVDVNSDREGAPPS